MGLLTRLREWFAGLLGGSGPDDSNGSAPETVESNGAAEGSEEGNGNEGLDPTAVTETRSDATDDAVDALRNVRESGPATDADRDDVHRDGTHEDDPVDRAVTDSSGTDAPADDTKG